MFSRRFLLVLTLLSVAFAYSHANAPQSGGMGLNPVPRLSLKVPLPSDFSWDAAGAVAVVDSSYLRLTPFENSKKGSLWSKQPNTAANWMARIKMQITGSQVGGDGLAFWYVKEKGAEGPVYGSAEKWTGLAVMFDTYDNDNDSQNPVILGVLNDGTVNFDRFTDGKDQAFGRCVRKIRNTPRPFIVEIRYINQELIITSNLDADLPQEPCFRSKINLPSGYYVGISAATGGLADKHDIHSLEFFEFTSTPTRPSPQALKQNPQLSGGNTESVASEIRTLASQTSQLSEFVSELSQSIQHIRFNIEKMTSNPSGVASQGVDGVKAQLTGLQLSMETINNKVDMVVNSVGHSNLESRLVNIESTLADMHRAVSEVQSSSGFGMMDFLRIIQAVGIIFLAGRAVLKLSNRNENFIGKMR